MIFTRFGEQIELVRLATLEDVKTFENRRPDKSDRDRTADGWRAIAVYKAGGMRHPGDELIDREALVDAAFLKADGGWTEISKAFQALPGSPIRV